jgi:hypothetical protein
MPESRASAAWKTVVLSGAGLLALGLSAFGVDFVTRGHLDLLEHYYVAFGLSILIGILAFRSSTGLEEWTLRSHDVGIFHKASMQISIG